MDILQFFPPKLEILYRNISSRVAKSTGLSSIDTWAVPKMSGLGELVCKFARKALVPFHEPHKGIDRSDPRASALFQLERNTRRGAAAVSIHNRARTLNTLIGTTTACETCVCSRTCVLQSLSDIRHSRIFRYPRIRRMNQLLKKKKKKFSS